MFLLAESKRKVIQETQEGPIAHFLLHPPPAFPQNLFLLRLPTSAMLEVVFGLILNQERGGERHGKLERLHLS